MYIIILLLFFVAFQLKTKKENNQKSGHIPHFGCCMKPVFYFFVVGQCGNQIGYRFWDLALREHAAVNKVLPRNQMSTLALLLLHWAVHEADAA